MRALRAVFFDIDDTLYSTTGFARAARRNAVRAMLRQGLRGRESHLVSELEEVISEFGSNYDHHLRKLLTRLDPADLDGRNAAVLEAAGVVGYHQTKFEQFAVYEEVPEVLAALRDKGLRLGIISAGLTIKQAEKLVRLQILEYLDPAAIFISDQVGISKPNPKLYSHACETLGLDHEQAMVVGDNPRNDIDPPNELGMITVWHTRTGKHALGISEPDYTIADFRDLLALVEANYAVPAP